MQIDTSLEVSRKVYLMVYSMIGEGIYSNDLMKYKNKIYYNHNIMALYSWYDKSSF